MNKKNFMAIVVMVLFALPSFSLAHDEPVDNTGWQNDLAIGFNISRGNTENYLLTVLGNAKLEEGDDIWHFGVNGALGETTDRDTDVDTDTNESVDIFGNYKHLFTDRFYGGINTSFRYDDIADVDYRFIISPGLGYFLVKNENFDFYVEAGPSYVFEELGGIDDEYISIRAAEGFNWQISETAKIYHHLEWIRSLEESDKWLLSGNLGIEAELSSLFSLVVLFQDDFDNLPAVGLGKNDFSVISALKVNL